MAEVHGGPGPRPGQPADRAGLIRMRQALWPDSEPDEVDEILSGRRGRVWFLVYERANGKLGGFVEVGTRSYAEGCHSSPVAYLEGLWVDSDLRRGGVARGLVVAVEAWALAEGFQEIASDADLENRGSQAFHQAYGFEETDRVVCYRKSLDPSSVTNSSPWISHRPPARRQ